MYSKIGALKTFAKFTGKHLCWSLFLIKLQTLSAGPQPCNFIKNGLQHRCFPMNLLKFLRLICRTPPVAASFFSSNKWMTNPTLFLKNFMSWYDSCRSSHPEVFYKIKKFVVKKICSKATVLESPCEFCEIFKNTYFVKHWWRAASVII